MLRIAKKLAQKSDLEKNHHAVIITKGGKIIATGYNHKFMHAEIDAIRKVETQAIRSGRKLKGLTLYSFRWTKGGNVGNALPCGKCMMFLFRDGDASDTFRAGQLWDIQTVYYTNDNGQLVRL